MIDTTKRNRTFDVMDDGTSVLSRPVLESNAPGSALTKVTESMGTKTAVVAYGGVGSALAMWWGSGGILGFLANATLWPAILGVKVIATLFWPAVIVGGLGAGAWWALKGKGSKFLGR